MSAHTDDSVRDPRRLGAAIVGPGGPRDRHGVVVDTTDAVLLDGVVVALVEPYRAGEAGSPVLACELAGRVNKTTDRASVVYLFDEDGAAALVTELLALASRIGPEFRERLLRRLRDLQDEGAT